MMKKTGKSAVVKSSLNQNLELAEMRELLLKGLKLSRKRMLAHKKKHNLQLAVDKAGKVVLINAATEL